MEDQAAQLRAMARESSFDFGRNAKKTRIITVTSGKGGVGKTNVSVNMAIAYAQMGKKVILIDADLGMANINVILNMQPKFNLYHVITHQKTMAEIVYKTDYGIRIVAGANGFSRIANLSDEDRDFFISELKLLSTADIIIIDTSAGISESVLDFVSAADEVILVSTPEPTAITDAYGMIKIVSTELEEYDVNIKMVVNRVNSAAEAKRIADRMSTIVAQFLNYKIEYLGYIYDDPVVSHAVIRQKPFLISSPQSKPALCIKHLVNRIEKIEVESDDSVGNFIQKLLRRQK